MQLNCEQLLQEREDVAKRLPFLAVRIDRILCTAKALYAQHGSPDGPGDEKAFKWYEARYNAWERQKYNRPA